MKKFLCLLLFFITCMFGLQADYDLQFITLLQKSKNLPMHQAQQKVKNFQKIYSQRLSTQISDVCTLLSNRSGHTLFTNTETQTIDLTQQFIDKLDTMYWDGSYPEKRLLEALKKWKQIKLNAQRSSSKLVSYLHSVDKQYYENLEPRLSMKNIDLEKLLKKV